MGMGLIIVGLVGLVVVGVIALLKRRTTTVAAVVEEDATTALCELAHVGGAVIGDTAICEVEVTELVDEEDVDSDPTDPCICFCEMVAQTETDETVVEDTDEEDTIVFADGTTPSEIKVDRNAFRQAVMWSPMGSPDNADDDSEE